MTDQELEQLLDDIESDRVEQKESVADGDKIRQAICAFANDLPGHDQPGILFVGVDDAGRAVGLNVTDQMLQDLAAMRGDGNILPVPLLDVQKRTLKGNDVAVVLVHPSNSPPVKFKGTIWIRSGPRCGIANPDDERRLSEKRRHRDLPADIRPVASAELNVLDEQLFLPHLPSGGRHGRASGSQSAPFGASARRLQVRSSWSPPARPTLLGVLTIGRMPTDWAPGAYVQFLRIDGKALGDPVSNQKKVGGPLPELLDELEDLIKTNIQTSLVRSAADYPVVALRTGALVFS